MNQQPLFTLNDLDQHIRNISMNAPLTKAPLARWQRKNMEMSASSLSINNSLNASLYLNCTVDAALPSNISLSVPISSSQKTPTTTPTRSGSRPITPSNRSGSKKLSASGHKSGHKLGRTPKTPIGVDRFIPDRSALNIDVSHFLVSFLKLNLASIHFSCFAYSWIKQPKMTTKMMASIAK